MKMLKDSGGGYYAVIAGEGYDSTAIREYTKKIGIEDSVLFTGQISDRALLYGLYSASGLFFFPSDYDTSGLVIREAALVETPSLLHAGSDAAEVVTDGYNGYTEDNDPAKMAAKIQSIFSDPSALAETGKHAKETIPVSWDDIVLRASEQYRIAKKRSYEPVDVRKEKMQIESEGI
jgi:glycosyltransferase involved in cell wall biosynthesis